MKAVDLFEYLSANEYPGRGIVIGRTPCGKKMRIGYFIMGRSVNSRNRVFIEEGDSLRTQAYDPSKLSDPSLIIYAPVRVIDGKTIVTNGNQTDTVFEGFKAGKSFEQSLRTRTFEPDAPNFTPRISAVVEGSNTQFSILKSGDPEGTTHHRQFFDYTDERPGYGHLIHTYMGNGDPIPSFEGEPVLWQMVKEPFDAFSNHLWESLNPDNKVSLYTISINLETGERETRIFNKNGENA